MTLSHESGHLIGGMASGATLTSFSLVPWRMPYSVHTPDPHPLVTLWAGPLFGVVLPLIAASTVRRRWVWFVAHFCLLANGGYLALSWLAGDRYLDTPRLLDAGAHPASIIGYCVLTIGFGYVRLRNDCIHYLSPTPKSFEPIKADLSQ